MPEPNAREGHLSKPAVPVFDHRHDVHQVCLRPRFIGYQFHETNKILTQKRADENTMVQKRRFLLVHGLDILAVMRIGLALTDRVLVVDLPDSPNQGFVERHLVNGDPFFFSLSGPIFARTNGSGDPASDRS